MLNNLSRRERILAIIVLSLLPAVLVLGGFVWFTNSMSDKEDQIANLRSAVKTEKSRQMMAMAASDRRRGYRAASLPTDKEAGFNLYFDWLFDVAKEIGLKDPQQQKAGEGKKNFDGKVVYYSQAKTFTCLGTLDQLTEFLYRFHQKKALHKIKRITVAPTNADVEAGTRIPSEQPLRIVLTIEAVSLPDGDNQKALAEGQWNRLPETLDFYKSKIVHRNIFGPPNSAPVIGSISAGTPRPEREISFPIRATDADEHELEYELISAGAKGAKLEPTRDGVMFISPGLAEGNYSYEVKVTDNGCPAKTDTKTFSFRVKKPTERKIVKEDPIPDAETAVVNSLTRNVKNQMEVWIYFQSLGRRSVYVAGETFELDGKQWKIISHDYSNCIIQCEDQLLTYQSGNTLANPSETKALSEKLDTIPTTAPTSAQKKPPIE